MASNSLSSHLEELRSGYPQSPPNERTYSGYSTPSRYSGSFVPSQNPMAAADLRSTLQRRFTTSSDTTPNLFSFGHVPAPAAVDPSDNFQNRYAQAMEKKRLDMEMLRQKKREFERELEKFQQKQAQEFKQLEQLAIEINSMDLHKLQTASGHLSEPSTPPSERVADYGFPSIYSRHNRYSSSSIVSPPSASANRMSRSGSMLTSPPYDAVDSTQNNDKLPSKSVPGSRRGSNDRMSAFFTQDLPAIGQQPNGNSNRYSMPVTSSMSAKRTSVMDDSNILDQHNTAKFLFGDDDERPSNKPEAVTSPGGKTATYLQMQTTKDEFPILLRQTEAPAKPTSAHAALDLAGSDATSAAAGAATVGNGWPTFPRHRQGQQSLPQNLFGSPEYPGMASAPTSARQSMEISSPPSFTARPMRHSMENSLAGAAKNLFGQGGTTTPTSRPGLAGNQPSYSTNDLPTVKNTMNLNLNKSPPRQSAEEAFHKHNASLGRIPAGAVNRSSRDLSSIASKLQETPTRDEKRKPSPPQLNTMNASSAAFGPSLMSTVGSDANVTPTSPTALSQFGGLQYYGGYNMQQLLSMGVSPVQMNSAPNFAAGLAAAAAAAQMGPQVNAQMFPYQAQQQQQQHQHQQQQQQPPYGFYTPAASANNVSSGQPRTSGQRRSQTGEESSRFSHARIENYQGEIYNLCKDQHGCRYLQRQLEARDPAITKLIFQETHQHVVELMTDPFGNYLCQKLLEHANDEQRTVLVNNAAPQMVKIALNQHGTRALQKMIEYITTSEQTQTIINALRDKVVQLIQDLNGNHVIQKCLNRLSSEDAQFIFDAVGTNCVVVGTHRHGCCVLQRCIDHASASQRADLIAHITRSAYSLVQDPFGNYVLQYIVDLKNPEFINPLCHGFQNNVVGLSKHKFSSNVIEKMIRGADQNVSCIMIEGMLKGSELESMLKDQFANYVVQTALDYSDPATRQRLVDAIRPMLPAIRQTPYGRRIQSKIAASENAMSRSSTNGDGATPRTPLGSQQNENLINSPQRQSGGTNATNFSNFTSPSFGVGGGLNGMSSPVASKGINNKPNGVFNPYMPGDQNGVQQGFAAYNQASQQGGFGFF